MTVPSLEEIRAARARIAPHLHCTPIVRSTTFERETGVITFFKCENLQKVGAFKARGACNAVLALAEAEAARGVITHSSGNHGQALAWAASLRRIPCVVVMPEDAPQVKIAAVRGYGGEPVLVPRASRDEVCQRLARERRMTFVHPFEDPRVIAGQGTVALEMLEQVPDLDAIVVPIGGGGQAAGIAIVVRELRPQLRLIGAEPAVADDAARSLASGVRQPSTGAASLADGLLTGIGVIAFQVLQEVHARVVTVSEAQLATAARFVLERMKLVVEPSGAIVVAAVRNLAGELAGKRVGAVLSGGNTDFRWLVP